MLIADIMRIHCIWVELKLCDIKTLYIRRKKSTISCCSHKVECYIVCVINILVNILKITFQQI